MPTDADNDAEALDDHLALDDLALNAEHAALYLAEQGRFEKILKLSVAISGVPAADHAIFVADLRGAFGKAIGENVVGSVIVEHRLRTALGKGIRPSFSVPLPICEAADIVELFGADVLDRVRARPLGCVAVIIADQYDNPALMFLEPVPGQPRGGT
jgi:hypothetical protein